MMQDELNSGLSAKDFDRLAEFIQGYAGIKMPAAKKVLVEGRLRRRVKALGMDTLSDYCHFLFEENGLAEESVKVIDAVTTNKTEFFRESQHFSFLSEKALPQLLSERKEGRARTIKAWSAASSSGAEPYTMAIVLSNFLERQAGFNFTVYATDICTDVLETGARGVYPEDAISPVPHDLRRRYFRRSKDPKRQEVRVSPDLREKVKFSHLNLMSDNSGMPSDMDVIFCRNVLIYFDSQTQGRVLRHLCGHLRPGGFLFVGHTEALSGHGLPVKAVSNAVFVRD